MRRSQHRIAAAALAFTLVAAACDSGPADDSDDAFSDETSEEPSRETDAAERDADEVEPWDMSERELAEFVAGLSDEEFDDFTDSLSDAELDELLDLVEAYESGELEDDPATDTSGSAEPTRNDVDCSSEGLGGDETFEFTTAHVIVDGRLGELCFGEPDARVTDAWNALAAIAPTGQLGDLGLFGGFEANEGGAEVTLAFVNPLDADGTLFQMSINLDSYEDDPAEAQLTMAHEFAHVFTLLPSQIDRTDEAIDDCGTYYNGEGCYLDTSLMWQWIDEF